MKQPGNPRRNQLNIRVTDEEYERICRAAHRAKRSPAEWCRMRLLALAPCLSDEAEPTQKAG